jgi:hypothetical protein
MISNLISNGIFAVDYQIMAHLEIICIFYIITIVDFLIYIFTFTPTFTFSFTYIAPRKLAYK